MKMIKIKVSYAECPKRFNREMLVVENLSLYELGVLILTALRAEFEHMFLFEDKKYQYVDESWLGSFIPNQKDYTKVTLSDVILDSQNEFTLVYDTGDYWEFKIKVTNDLVNINDCQTLAICTKGNGDRIWEDYISAFDKFLKTGIIDDEYIPWNLPENIEEYNFDEALDLEDINDNLQAASFEFDSFENDLEDIYGPEMEESELLSILKMEASIQDMIDNSHRPYEKDVYDYELIRQGFINYIENKVSDAYFLEWIQWVASIITNHFPTFTKINDYIVGELKILINQLENHGKTYSFDNGHALAMLKQMDFIINNQIIGSRKKHRNGKYLVYVGKELFDYQINYSKYHVMIVDTRKKEYNFFYLDNMIFDDEINYIFTYLDDVPLLPSEDLPIGEYYQSCVLNPALSIEDIMTKKVKKYN